MRKFETEHLWPSRKQQLLKLNTQYFQKSKFKCAPLLVKIAMNCGKFNNVLNKTIVYFCVRVLPKTEFFANRGIRGVTIYTKGYWGI